MDNENNLYEKTDEELVEEARKNNNENAYNILAKRYESSINGMTKNFFAIGSEAVDLQQEGLIGLYLAVQNFDKEKDIKFKTFANLCIKRKLITYLKTTNRKKNEFFNNSISLDAKLGVGDEENDTEYRDVLADSSMQDPCHMLAENEYRTEVKNAIYQKLSLREKNVLDEYIKGKSYVDIANNLKLNVKSVDTALTRIRRKANEVKHSM